MSREISLALSYETQSHGEVAYIFSVISSEEFHLLSESDILPTCLAKAAGVLRILSVLSRSLLDVEGRETANPGPLSGNMSHVEPLKASVPQFPHLRNRRWQEDQDTVRGVESQQCGLESCFYPSVLVHLNFSFTIWKTKKKKINSPLTDLV